MKIQLQSPAVRNWLLRADSLNDPETWSRFVPCTHECDRYMFDSVVLHEATELGVKVRQCKDLLVIGSSIWEYDWESDQDQIVDHAMKVGELLGVQVE